jgi:hypothetical protein
VGIARRPFDPAAHGWAKLEYRRGDVRDPGALRDAFRHADVVVHLAFLVTGTAAHGTIRSVNIEGTLNAFRAAATAGARRFVYASSVAAYGFHPDNPVGMTEQWPVRPAARLFYAREKAELEHLLRAEAAAPGRPALYLLRPSIVAGPHAVGGKAALPWPLAPLAHALARTAGRLRVPVPVPMGFSPLPTSRGNLACSRCRCPRARFRLPPGSSRACLSCHPLRNGWKRPAIRRSWTRPVRNGTWAGHPASPRSGHCVTPCGGDP